MSTEVEQAPKDLPYMTEADLKEFIDSAGIDLTKEETEYLYIKRRRMSLAKVCISFFS